MGAFSANLNVMVTAARKASRFLLRDFGEVENLQVSVKGVGDFVSNADRKAENTIKEELMRARAAYGWLGEESAPITGADETRRWIVDPLDGTTNFLHGIPHWAISIALQHRSEIVAAVVFDPIKDELFTAEKGQGAWMNGRRLRVSARREISECLFSTGIPFGAKATLGQTLTDIKNISPGSAGIRRFGSAALDLAYVAAGRYDGYWERELQPWDIAAGLLLVREAGGFAKGLVEGTDPIETGALVAANAAIFEKFHAVVRQG